MKQGKRYLARVYIHCWSINILVCLCMCIHACGCISTLLAQSCSRRFISGGPAWPQRCPACGRGAGLGPALLVLLGHSAQVFFLCLTEEQRLDMTNLHPLFNHAEQEKSLACLYDSSHLALRPELVRYWFRHPSKHTFLKGFLLEGSHCFTVPG